jgi:hypothetical protein
VFSGSDADADANGNRRQATSPNYQAEMLEYIICVFLTNKESPKHIVLNKKLYLIYLTSVSCSL